MSMALRTKCMNAVPSDSDGLRICVMRNANVYNRHLKLFQKHYGRPMYDMHMKALAPSTELKDAYKHGDLSWKEYQPIFRQEVLKNQSDLVKMIAFMAQYQDVTLLCSEKTPEQCHRRLPAEECKRYQPKLELIVE